MKALGQIILSVVLICIILISLSVVGALGKSEAMLARFDSIKSYGSTLFSNFYNTDRAMLGVVHRDIENESVEQAKLIPPPRKTTTVDRVEVLGDIAEEEQTLEMEREEQGATQVETTTKQVSNKSITKVDTPVKMEPIVSKQETKQLRNYDIPSRDKNVIYFAWDSFEASPVQLKRLLPLVSNYKKTQKIIIKGYSDSFGSAQVNRRLSRLRAVSVATFLVQNGVPFENIEIEAQGEVATGARSEKGSWKNRKVVVVVQ